MIKEINLRKNSKISILNNIFPKTNTVQSLQGDLASHVHRKTIQIDIRVKEEKKKMPRGKV
jgi:hypothetical protein